MRPDHLTALAYLAHRFSKAQTLSTSFASGRAGQSAFFAADQFAPTAEPLNHFAMALDQPMMWTSYVAVDRATFVESCGFDASVPGEDLDLWVRLALAGPITASPPPPPCSSATALA